jgi:hypothetical protein
LHMSLLVLTTSAGRLRYGLPLDPRIGDVLLDNVQQFTVNH